MKSRETEKEEKKFSILTLSEERRGDPAKNEDQLFYKENENFVLAGVFDGATALSEIPYFNEIGKTPGRLAAEIGRDVLKEASFDQNPDELIFSINSELQKVAGGIPVSSEVKSELFTAVGLIARLDKTTSKFSFAGLGDVTLIVLTKAGSAMWRSDERTEAAERKEISAGLSAASRYGIPLKEVLGHPEVSAVVAANRKLENDPAGKGYGALKGSDSEAIREYLTKGEVKLESGDRAFLLSDGMFVAPLLNEGQRKDAEALLRKGGIRELLQETRRLQESDPDCSRFPRFKQFDDATGVEIQIGGTNYD